MSYLNTSIGDCPSGNLCEFKLLCFAFIYFGSSVHSGGGICENVAIYANQKVTTKKSNILIIFVVKSLVFIQK